MIPCSDPRAQYLALRKEIDLAVKKVFESGRYILGSEVASFEREFAAYIGVNHCLGVGSGTEAIHLALKTCGIGPGDEVITVSHTAVATVAAIELTGAVPVFVDIDAETYCMDPADLMRAVTPKSRAVIPVHLYGHPAPLDKITAIARRHGLLMIEDCAQAHGAVYQGKKAGAFGNMACFSFYPSKNLGGLGDGGAVLTNDPDLLEKARLLREYGWKNRFVSSIKGWNTRLDEVQAAILRVKLHHLDENNAARKRLAELYDKGLKETGMVLPVSGEHSSHVYHLYVARTERRANLIAFLRARGIESSIHYPIPVHMQPAYSESACTLPVTELIASKIISLPIYPELKEEDISFVIRSIQDFFSAGGER